MREGLSERQEEREVPADEEGPFRTQLDVAYALRDAGPWEEARKAFQNIADVAEEYDDTEALAEAKHALQNPPTVH